MVILSHAYLRRLDSNDFICLSTTVILLVLHLTNLGLLIHQQIPDRPQRRLFNASVSFFITFVAVRLLVASITHHIGPFSYVEMGGRHIHHLVWGILLLLIFGYAELAKWARAIARLQFS